jgi:hypothetical protein
VLALPQGREETEGPANEGVLEMSMKHYGHSSLGGDANLLSHLGTTGVIHLTLESPHPWLRWSRATFHSHVCKSAWRWTQGPLWQSGQQQQLEIAGINAPLSTGAWGRRLVWASGCGRKGVDDFVLRSRDQRCFFSRIKPGTTQSVHTDT